MALARASPQPPHARGSPGKSPTAAGKARVRGGHAAHTHAPLPFTASAKPVGAAVKAPAGHSHEPPGAHDAPPPQGTHDAPSADGASPAGHAAHASVDAHKACEE